MYETPAEQNKTWDAPGEGSQSSPAVAMGDKRRRRFPVCFFLTNLLHLTVYLPGESRTFVTRRAAWMSWKMKQLLVNLPDSLSHRTSGLPVALKKKEPTHHRGLHFGGIIKVLCSLSHCISITPVPFPSEWLRWQVNRLIIFKYCPRPIWNPLRAALRQLILSWLTSWCQKDHT